MVDAEKFKSFLPQIIDFQPLLEYDNIIFLDFL